MGPVMRMATAGYPQSDEVRSLPFTLHSFAPLHS